MTKGGSTATSSVHDLAGGTRRRSDAGAPGWCGPRGRSFASHAPAVGYERIPTPGQLRAMAHIDGREPCSYLLDPGRNFVPEPPEFGYERELSRHALCFSYRDPYRRAMELVAMSDGGGSDLLGIGD